MLPSVSVEVKPNWKISERFVRTKHVNRNASLLLLQTGLTFSSVYQQIMSALKRLYLMA